MQKTKEYIYFKQSTLRLAVPLYSNFIPYATFFAGEYDFLNPGKDDTVIDAGANIGDYAVKIAKKVRKVVAIEPFPVNIKTLEMNCAYLPNVTIVRRAIGNSKKRVGFSGQGVSASVDESSEVTVEMDTLDNICADLKITPTILKMDIEGQEGSALEGFKDHLEFAKRAVIEVHDNTNKERCERIFRDFGFKMRYQTKFDVMKRTFKNVVMHLPSFISYERINDFYASRVILNYPLSGKTTIPSCGEKTGMYLLEAWKE